MILTNCRKLLTNPNGNNYNVTVSMKMDDGSSGAYTGSTIFSSSGNLVIKLGTGTDEVTQEDYKLSNMVSPSRIENSYKYGGNINNYTRLATVITTYNNNTSDNITVTELGICHETGITSGGVTTYKRFFLTRELLEEPITIAPGESYSFTASIDLF